MYNLLLFLSATFAIAWIVGLINPNWVLFFLKKYKNRLIVSLIYFTGSLVFIILAENYLPNYVIEARNKAKQDYIIKDSLAQVEYYKQYAIDELKKENKIVHNSDLDGSVSQVEDYLKTNLNDPDSYGGIDWAPVSIVEATNHKFVVRHKYRAKNKLGGYLILNQLFYLDKTGVVVDVSDWN